MEEIDLADLKLKKSIELLTKNYLKLVSKTNLLAQDLRKLTLRMNSFSLLLEKSNLDQGPENVS